MVAVSSWGRLSAQEHDVRRLSSRYDLLTGFSPGLAYGMGRSYGDVCLNPGGVLWQTTGLNRFISFDDKTGHLVCEAGVLLRDIQRLMLPRGWLLPVTPGTEWVTVGGAVANDVHGKNHHNKGSFGHHVTQLTLLRTDNTRIECGPELQPEWFAATVGGLGLTGLILTAGIQLRPVDGPWIMAETIAYSSLNDFFKLVEDSVSDWEYTVSWVDCMAGRKGRGIFIRGNHTAVPGRAIPRVRARTFPITSPVSLVNRFSLKPLNALYFYKEKKAAGQRIVHYEPFFYPLDNLLEWNRLYGRNGFYQYQSVVPLDVGKEVTEAMLAEISLSSQGSFLSVLKTFGGKRSLGMLGFPQQGVTLALDFPNRGSETLQLLTRLDAIVNDARGRVYLAKDARMSRPFFEASYANLASFLPYRDPGISSG